MISCSIQVLLVTRRATSSRSCLEICFTALDLKGRRTCMSFNVSFWSFWRNQLCGQIQDVDDLHFATRAFKNWWKVESATVFVHLACLLAFSSQNFAFWNFPVKSWTFLCNLMACTCLASDSSIVAEQTSPQYPCEQQCWGICTPLSPHRISWGELCNHYWPCLPV